jgi:hypothetical protein
MAAQRDAAAPVEPANAVLGVLRGRIDEHSSGDLVGMPGGV